MTIRDSARENAISNVLTISALLCAVVKPGRALGLIFLLGIIFLLASNPMRAQAPKAPTTAPGGLVDPESYIRADRLGITFIGFIDNNMGAERYRKALILGAGWNRWPLYWDRIERQPNQFDWAAYDALVASDIHHGLQTNAILLGRPRFRQAGESIANLYAPIFANGGDSGGAGDAINPENHWAQFVQRAVARYKPGGLLARQPGFPADAGIRAWEVWNEPDFDQFWRGGSDDYARLLKVASIVIKTVDPEAKVIFGGLLFASDQGFLSRVLRQIQNDPLRDRYNWFIDVIALHSYDDPWRSGWLAKVIQDTLKEYRLTRPVWLNETGVSVWDDYPGPVWASRPEERIRLATARQQAHYLIMSAAFAWLKGVDLVIYHQLYDDCGNYPAGTDFQPHNGELCANGVCFGDAFGLYRNPRGSHCFSHHPHANTPRPVAQAFRLLAEVFGRQAFAPISLQGLNEAVTAIEFRRANGDHIIVLWNNTREALSHVVEAMGASVEAHYINGESAIMVPSDGSYTFRLEPAGDYSFPDLESHRIGAIGGEPIILVETPSP